MELKKFEKERKEKTKQEKKKNNKKQTKKNNKQKQTKKNKQQQQQEKKKKKKKKKKKNTIRYGAQSLVSDMSDFYMIMPQPIRLPLLQCFLLFFAKE